MSDETAETPVAEASGVVIPAKLGPTDAAELKDDVLKVLEDADGTLEISLDGEDPTACAVQVLVATRRTAESKGLKLSYTELAATVFDGIEMH